MLNKSHYRKEKKSTKHSCNFYIAYISIIHSCHGISDIKYVDNLHELQVSHSM